MRAARGARTFFFFIRPIKSLFLALSVPSSLGNWGAYAKTTAMAAKTSLENKHLGNGDYFQIIAPSSHPTLLIEHAANGQVEGPLKLILRMKDLLLRVHVVIWQTTSKNYAKVRAARAARLFLLIEPTRSLFSGVVVAVAVVFA